MFIKNHALHSNVANVSNVANDAVEREREKERERETDTEPPPLRYQVRAVVEIQSRMAFCESGTAF